MEESDWVVIRKTNNVVGAGADRGVVAGAGEVEGDAEAEGELKNGFSENREVELFRVVDGCFGGGTDSPLSVASKADFRTTGFPHMLHVISAGCTEAYSLLPFNVLTLTGSITSSPARMA